MDNIVDLNFNFDLFNKIIEKELAGYDVLKNLYFDGADNGEDIYEAALKLIKLIEETIYLIDVRQKIINKMIVCENDTEKFSQEKENLSRLSLWYKKLINSISYEKEKYLSGEFGIDLDL